MKTERRHELQTNVLADRLAHWIEVAEPYGRAILAGVVAIFVLIFAYLYISSRETERLSDAWDHYFQAFNAGDSAKLNSTAESYPRTPVANWARLMTADMLLTQSIDRLFIEKADARDEIRRAADMYQTVRRDSDERAIIERATFGLARAHESLGELDKARVEYQAVAKADGPYAGLAEERASDLETPEGKEFYDWFAKFEPKRSTDKPDKKPDFMHESLEGPASELRLPSSITDKIPASATDTVPPATPPVADKSSPTDDAAAPTDKPTAPADKTSPPADKDKPAGEGAAAGDKPAAEPASEKPAPEKPASEKPTEPSSEKSAGEK